MWSLSDGEVTAALAEREAAVRRMQAEMLVLVAELERRSPVSRSRARQVLRDDLHLSNRAVREWLRCADATQPHQVLGRAGGTVLLPGARDAFHAAEISGEHVGELARVFARCPSWVSDADRAELEESLLALARTSSPEAVRKEGEELVALWEADGQPPSDEDLARPRRELRCSRSRRDGTLKFRGFLDTETGDRLESLLGVLAKPVPTKDGTADERSRAERDGDALAEIIDAAARADDATVQGGETAVMVVTATVEELRSGAQQALLDVPGCMSLDSLRRMACEARVVPAVFGADGEPLYLGRSHRHASAPQRRALAVRDKGCAFPGCTRPPKWTQPHHVVHWEHGGPTDADNLVLLCAAHHRVVHHTGWDVRTNPKDRLPDFIPPEHVDPQRRPLRNHAHGPPRQLYQRFCREPRGRATLPDPW